MEGKLFIVSSPSGGGKGTLIRRALSEISGLVYSVSFTTRPMRTGETNGKEYHFVTEEEFRERIAGDDLLEYATVHGNFYGTSREQIEKATGAGEDIIVEIDVQGAAIVKRKCPDAISIFILPPSFEVLASRLRARGTESEEQIGVRLRNAREEIREYRKADYLVVNDDLERAVADLEAIITAERLKPDRQTTAIKGILNSFES